MNRRSHMLWIVPLLVVSSFAIVGCENPADGKTEAVVEEAKPESAASASGAVYALNADSKLTWTGSKVTGKHDGGFNAFTGDITLGDTIEASSVSIDIDMTSVWSDSDGLTEHLMSGDFFEIESFPTASFNSTSIAKTDDGYEITGNLEMRGITKSITFPATIEHTGDQVTAQAEFVIQRFDWGIVYAGQADNLIRDEVVIGFDLSAGPAA